MNKVMGENKSPLPGQTNPTKVKLLTFPEAMQVIIEGRKVYKLEWKDKNYYGFLNGEFLSLHKPDGHNYKWTISAGDLMGEDYVARN